MPVIPVEVEGIRYLVSPCGESDWVRNLRAADKATLARKGKVETFQATEVAVPGRAAIIAAYRKVCGRTVNPCFTKLPDPGDHPVFRLDESAHPAGHSASRPGPSPHRQQIIGDRAVGEQRHQPGRIRLTRKRQPRRREPHRARSPVSLPRRVSILLVPAVRPAWARIASWAITEAGLWIALDAAHLRRGLCYSADASVAKDMRNGGRDLAG